MNTVTMINPQNGQKLKTYTLHSDEEIAKIIDACHKTFLEWKRIPFEERSRLMHKVAAVFRENKKTYAELMTHEMGKLYRDGEAEVEKCAWVCEYYAKKAQEFLAPEKIETDASKSFVSFEPFGLVLAIMPWNFPFWQVFRFAAPALMAGNVGILKHASNVCGCALAIEDIFRKAGFPENTFRTLLASSRQITRVIENKKVQAVTLTGSEGAGKAVAQKAGEMLKKTVLELGGSDPYIILADADIQQAAEICVDSRLINGGQSCIAAKRFIIESSVYDIFEDAFVGYMRTRQMGDPMDPETHIPPMARYDLRDELHKQVEDSITGGARKILGGEIPDTGGAHYPATVLVDLNPNVRAWREEIFGPIASLIKAKDESDAVRIANDSPYGLGAAVFTSNRERGERIATKALEAGCCFVNSFVKSDPRLPFGGIKSSGYGRELSHFGIREFVNIKTVYLA